MVYFNGNAVSRFVYNNQTVNKVIYNGVQVFPDNSDYTFVSYLQSSGTQYINTGIAPSTTQKYRIKYTFLVSANLVAFGSRTSGTYSNSTNQVYYNYSSGTNFYFYAGNNGNGGRTDFGSSSALKDADFTFDLKNGSFTNNSTSNTGTLKVAVTSTPTYPLFLFALNSIGSPAAMGNMRIYSFKLYDNDVLTMDLQPAIRNSDSAIGMYDLVSDSFFANAGSGDFTYA